MTVEIHDLLQANCHCVIPVNTERKRRDYSEIKLFTENALTVTVI